MTDLQIYLSASAARHSHLCPRQVLGVRIALAGADALQLSIPRTDKCLMVIVETDGCFADGVEVVTGATVGHRTMRIEDYGKIAATFIDVHTNKSIRIAPRLDIRQLAWDYAPNERRHYFAQLHAYQVIPQEKLLEIQPIQLKIPIEKIISRAGIRSDCENCGEEIINQREIYLNGMTLCRACAGQAYYINHIESEVTS